MISEMYADLLLPSIPTLREAADEPVDNDSLAKDSGNKDLANDAKDATSDKDDVESESEDTDDTADEDSADENPDDAPDDESTEDTDQPDDGDDSDDAPDDESTEDDSEQTTEDKEKKLALYESLREIRTSHSSVNAVLEALSTKTDLPASALELIKVLRNKVSQNIESLDDLLINVKFVTSRSYAEILVVHNIYISDLRMIDSNLGKYNRYMKTVSDNTTKTKAKK